jgi:adenosylhomocysteine nucleosidase
MGAECAEAAAEKLIKNGANALLSWGCAGGLLDGLSAGDLLVPARVVGVEGADYLVDEVWRNKVLQTLSIASDERVIAESLALLNDVVAKRQLAETKDAAAVDMESAAVLRVAKCHGLPGLVLRAVADTCHDSLPKSLDAALNPLGELRALRFAANLLRRPADIPALFALGTRFSRASATLRRTRSTLGAQFCFDE